VLWSVALLWKKRGRHAEKSIDIVMLVGGGWGREVEGEKKEEGLNRKKISCGRGRVV